MKLNLHIAPVFNSNFIYGSEILSTSLSAKMEEIDEIDIKSPGKQLLPTSELISSSFCCSGKELIHWNKIISRPCSTFFLLPQICVTERSIGRCERVGVCTRLEDVASLETTER